MIENLTKPFSSSTVKKISVSIKLCHWHRLEDIKNKSAMINNALELYFDREDCMLDAKETRVTKQLQKINDL